MAFLSTRTCTRMLYEKRFVSFLFAVTIRLHLYYSTRFVVVDETRHEPSQSGHTPRSQGHVTGGAKSVRLTTAASVLLLLL